MSITRSLFYLNIDENSFYDASPSGISLKPNRKVQLDVKNSKLIFNNGGFVKLNHKGELQDLEYFTIEATINLKAGDRHQTILDATGEGIKLYINESGQLVGAVRTNKWTKVTSGNTLIEAGKEYNILFSRDKAGETSLTINGETVESKPIRSKIKKIGSKNGFFIGAAKAGGADFFSGTLTGLSISSSVLSRQAKEDRIRRENTLTAQLRSMLNLERIVVRLQEDESYARLQPVKAIMNAVGVEDLNDLDTLQITSQTTITRGRVILAPRKVMESTNPIDWAELAKNIANIPKPELKTILATNLLNRNSKYFIQETINKNQSTKASSDHLKSNAPTSGGSLNMAPFLSRNKTGSSVWQQSKLNFVTSANAFERAKNKLYISEMMGFENSRLSVKNSGILNLIESPEPAHWANLANSQMVLMNSTSIPVYDSVIIAKTLDLTNSKLVIEPDVVTLWIIAEKVIAGPNAAITWRKPGGSTPPRANNPDLNGRGYSGIHTKQNSRDGLDGEDARDGITGIKGANGVNAPKLEIWVKELTAMPDIELNGEDGIRGGRGQRGGRGGNGANASGGKWAWFFGKHCVSDPGDGGDGGNGGDGGRGGRGGNGANGGHITIGVLNNTLESTVTNKAFKIKNQGGRRGEGGPGGEGGFGGQGGRSGAGEVCHDADNGHPGARGQRGREGADGLRNGGDGELRFHEFSEAAWEELLLRPWITELSPETPFPGDTLIIKGSKFTTNDRVRLGTDSISPTINADESLSITIPSTITGGEKELYIRRQDGSESNRLRLWIRPQLDPFSGVLNPGATVTVTGKAFLNGASVLVDGRAVPTNFVNVTTLSFEMPGTGGAGISETNITLQVNNPDGHLSNSRSATIPNILEVPFKFDLHSLNFDNFTDGAPSWGTFEDTFGTAEVWHELLDPIFGHPVLTAAYYGFYHHFLKGEANGGLATGFCTAMSSKVLDQFWTGNNDTFVNLDLTSNTRREFTAIHGRLLSRESLLHFHDQSREEVARVGRSYRDIETIFYNGVSRHNAPMLFFIPSGAAWDSGYFDRLGDSHCIVPIRFIYPIGHPGPAADGTTNPDGVTLFCWDCNHPPTEDSAAIESQNCRLEFFRQDGLIHYNYFDGGTTPKFSSTDGITLGVMSNGNYLLTDHDLPFGGPFGLTTFVLDFLLSPADLQVTNADGFRTGNFGSQILSEIPDSHPCYLAKGAYLLPTDMALTRRICGTGNGTYTYNSISPNGTSIVLENVDTDNGQEDLLSVNADGTQIRFTPAIDKNFTLTLGRQINDDIRAVAISGVGGGPTSDVDITLSPELSILRIGNRGAANRVSVTAFNANAITKSHSKLERGNVLFPANHDLVLAITDWENLDMTVQTVEF